MLAYIHTLRFFEDRKKQYEGPRVDVRAGPSFADLSAADAAAAASDRHQHAAAQILGMTVMGPMPKTPLPVPPPAAMPSTPTVPEILQIKAMPRGHATATVAEPETVAPPSTSAGSTASIGETCISFYMYIYIYK